HEAVSAALDSQRYQRLLLRLGIWMEQAPAGKHATTLDAFARATLQKRHRRLRKHGKRWHEMSGEERHAARIAAKKLRYAAEFFASLYPTEQTRPYLRRLARMLDTLGELNDMAVTDRLIARLMGSRPGKALGEVPLIVKGWNALSTQRQLKKLKADWNRLSDTRPFWE
ncbi:MAG: CHAD domain-containing protein, partial [Methylophilaceae bacterium]